MPDRATLPGLDRTSAVRQVIAELGDWAVGTAPLFKQLARAIAGGIERGALPRGSRLPSERALAAALVVSRGTAVTAYDRLVADGFIERRHGSGTYVLGTGQLGLPAGREGSALVHRLVSRSTAPDADLIDLSISVLADAAALPSSVAVSAADLAAVVPETGYSPWGLPGLRRATADYVSGWGLPTSDSEIVITTGAQQALACAAACWVRPGDVVVMDEPTYPGAVSAFTQAGAVLVGVPVDRHGVRADELEGVVRVMRPALVYVQSTFHSPTGVVLSEARRRRIAEVVAGGRVPLVEDMALAGLHWRPGVRLPPPIASFAPGASIAVVGSFSKLFWGGLRVGFVRAPEAVALRFARVKATHDLGSSAVSQVLTERLLEHVDAIADCQSEWLLERYEALAGAMRKHLPSWTWTEPSGGLSIWVQLPTPTAEAFAQAALRHGVAVATAPPLFAQPGPGAADRLRLSFSLRPDLLEEGVRRLAAAWKAGSSRSRPRPVGTRPR